MNSKQQAQAKAIPVIDDMDQAFALIQEAIELLPRTFNSTLLVATLRNIGNYSKGILRNIETLPNMGVLPSWAIEPRPVRNYWSPPPPSPEELKRRADVKLGRELKQAAESVNREKEAALKLSAKQEAKRVLAEKISERLKMRIPNAIASLERAVGEEKAKVFLESLRGDISEVHINAECRRVRSIK